MICSSANPSLRLLVYGKNSVRRLPRGAKHALTSLVLPGYSSKPFEVVCDALLTGTGAVLLQDGRPVAYEMRKLSNSLQSVSTQQVSGSCLLWCVQREHKNLISAGGVDVSAVVDHDPVVFLQTKATCQGVKSAGQSTTKPSSAGHNTG